MIHLAGLLWLFHPLVGRGYLFWSGIAGCFISFGLLSGLIAGYCHVNCHAPWCLRLGRHPTADGQFRLCRKHHPDLPKKKPTLREIHARHEEALGLPDQRSP